MTPSCVRSNRTIPTKTKSPSMTGILFWRHRFSSQVPDWDLRFATRNRKNDARHPHRRQVYFGLFASQIRVFVFFGGLFAARIRVSTLGFSGSLLRKFASLFFWGLFAARIRVSTLGFSGSSLREFAYRITHIYKKSPGLWSGEVCIGVLNQPYLFLERSIRSLLRAEPLASSNFCSRSSTVRCFFSSPLTS